MRHILDKYARKLQDAGLAASPESALVAGLDADLAWNTQAPAADRRTAALAPLFDRLAINSLVYTEPPEPYATVIRRLGRAALERGEPIRPQDCETRTFLHDLPVAPDLDSGLLARALASRKGAVILDAQGRGPAVVAHGSVSPEQGFATASSICFACFVKFFADLLISSRSPDARLAPDLAADLRTVLGALPPLPETAPQLMSGPFTTSEEVHLALIEAGRATVEHRLVDSHFGNISYLLDGVLYISQTGSSLDELAGHIDPCPLDGSSTAGLTASSELSAHLESMRRSGARAMLHGHPPFCVILSLDCPHLDCPHKGRCHLDCSEFRHVGGTPIVPGEVGTGPFGLCRTLPPALESVSRAIVYGHGLFALGAQDFTPAFASLLEVERACRRTCLMRLEKAFPKIQPQIGLGQQGQVTLYGTKF